MRLTLRLILSITISLSPPVILAEWLECDPPKSFAIELENGRTLFIYDAEVNVQYNRNDLAVYKYPNIDDVNILINNTAVSFSGHILSEDREVDPGAPKVSKTFNSKIAGFARLSKAKDNTDALIDYNLFLSRNHDEEEFNVPKKLQVEIIHEAVSCVKSTIDKNIGTITADDFERAKSNPYDFGSISVTSGNLADLRTKSFKSSIKPKITPDDVKLLLSNLTSSSSNNIENDNNGIKQQIIDKIVDLGIAELVERMRERNEGKITIPDLKQNFSTGSSWWETTGEFNAFDGTFEDLTTLSRKGHATLARDGMKFSTSCSFDLSMSNMKYQSYKLRYGIAKVNGKLSASVDGVTILATGSLDFTRQPCQAILLDTRVSELGKLKVKITGLGPLNKLLSKLVTWITKKWQDDIVLMVEQKLRQIIMEHLNVFDCEKYRPT